MKRYRITLLVPQTKEIVVKDAQAAHNEASRLAAAHALGSLKPVVHSVEYLEEVVTEEINYDAIPE